MARKMFFWRSRSQSEPLPGSLHMRKIGGRCGDRAIEQAEVLDVSRDGMGIPHVRYRVTHVQSGRSATGGFRVLALSSFLDQFREVRQAA